MSDNFEKFVRKNRRDFDNEAPSGQVWEKVETSLPVLKEKKRFYLRDIYKWSAAAAIVFIALTSVYFLAIRNKNHDAPRVATENPVETVNPLDPSRLSPEYAAQFKQVYQLIGKQQNELRTVTAGQPELYQQFQKDLGALDSAFQMLKKQAEQSPNRDVIIKAMIQNLRLQAEVLGRQLMISNEFNNTKNS
jgi:hypothetical protein